MQLLRKFMGKEKDISQIADQEIKRSNEYASFIMDGFTNNNPIIIYAKCHEQWFN